MKYSVLELQTRATDVWVEGDWVCLRLHDGRELRFPTSKSRRLAAASPEQVAHVELICNGTGLHWPELDEDLSVVGILEGRFGE